MRVEDAPVELVWELRHDDLGRDHLEHRSFIPAQEGIEDRTHQLDASAPPLERPRAATFCACSLR